MTTYYKCMWLFSTVVVKKTPEKAKTLAKGIIAGVVCTAIVLVLATIVFIFIRYRCDSLSCI